VDKPPAQPPIPVPVEDKQPARTVGIVAFACVAVAFALYFGREFFVPIAFGFVLNGLFRPVVRVMEKAKIPTPVAAAIVVLAIFAAMFLAGMLLSAPLQSWIANAPQRLAAAEEKLNRLRQPMQRVTAVAERIEHATSVGTTNPSDGKQATPAPAPGPVGGTLASRFFGTTSKALETMLETLLMLYLLLASGDLFMQKLIKVVPTWRDKRLAVEVVHEAESIVARYLVVTAMINTGQGIVIVFVMWWLKMPSPILWGVLTVVLEFVPYLGAAIMIAMLSVISFATFDSFGHILAVPGSYFVITTLQNNIVSPYAYGNRLKLNPVAVLIGVLLWWFLWGIAGAFLSVPIVATVKVIADRTEGLKALGEFLGE